MPMNIGGQTYSDEDIRNFFATTDNAGIAAQAASFGMNADQIAQAARISGRNWSASDITNWAVGNGYGFNASGAAQRAPAPAAPAWNRYAVAGTNANLPADYSAAQNLIAGNASNPNLDPNSRFNTGNFGGGRHLTVQQIRDFAATNPTNDQILEQAAAYGMNQEQLARALVYGRGDTLNDLSTNQMINSSNNYGYNSEGIITALNGQSKSAQNGNSALTINSGGGGGGSANLGMGGGSSSSGYSGGGGQNPYLQGMGQNIINQMTENYTRNQLPASRSGAMAAGGFGGSRQGVVEANGLNDLNRGIGQNLTNLYGTDWTNAQNRGLQQQSINNSYDLGLRSNDLGYANLDSNNQQFGANYGLNVMNAQNNWAQQGVQAANGIQNTPIDYSRYFQGQTSQMAGQGGSTTNAQTNQANPWLGALGGAQLANSWFNGRR